MDHNIIMTWHEGKPYVVNITLSISINNLVNHTGQESGRVVGVPPLLFLDTNKNWPGQSTELIKNHVLFTDHEPLFLDNE